MSSLYSKAAAIKLVLPPKPIRPVVNRPAPSPLEAVKPSLPDHLENLHILANQKHKFIFITRARIPVSEEVITRQDILDHLRSYNPDRILIDIQGFYITFKTSDDAIRAAQNMDKTILKSFRLPLVVKSAPEAANLPPLDSLITQESSSPRLQTKLLIALYGDVSMHDLRDYFPKLLSVLRNMTFSGYNSAYEKDLKAQVERLLDVTRKNQLSLNQTDGRFELLQIVQLICEAFLDPQFANCDRDLTRDSWINLWAPNLITLSIVILGQMIHFQYPEFSKYVAQKALTVIEEQMRYVKSESWLAASTEIDCMWKITDELRKMDAAMKKYELRQSMKLQEQNSVRSQTLPEDINGGVQLIHSA